MNNLSDSDNFNSNENVLKIDASKRRGRPKKAFFNTDKDKQIKTSPSIKEFTNNDRDLILHLPVKLKKEEKNNKDNNNKDNKEEKEIKNNKENLINTNEIDLLSTFDSDDDSIKSDDEINSDNELDYNENNYKKKYLDILEKYKEKEIELNKYKNKQKNINLYEPNVYKEMINHIIDLKLINKDTNKVIDIQENKSACWWCSYEFNNIPCFIPEKYYNDKYYVFGCFCSVNCASEYNLNLNDYKMHERYALLKKLYNNLIDDVDKIAPPKEVLTKYGGIVTIEKYRENFKICNRDYILKLPPVIFLNHIIDEIIIEKSEVSETQNINNINSLKKKLPKNNLFSYSK